MTGASVVFDLVIVAASVVAAVWALILAAVLVAFTGAGYAAGLRDRQTSAAPGAEQAPCDQETVDLGARLLAQMYAQPCAPEPRRPGSRRPRRRGRGGGPGPWPPRTP